MFSVPFVEFVEVTMFTRRVFVLQPIISSPLPRLLIFPLRTLWLPRNSPLCQLCRWRISSVILFYWLILFVCLVVILSYSSVCFSVPLTFPFMSFCCFSFECCFYWSHVHKFFVIWSILDKFVSVLWVLWVIFSSTAFLCYILLFSMFA